MIIIELFRYWAGSTLALTVNVAPDTIPYDTSFTR